MKQLTFTYTKADNKTSERNLLAMSFPSAFYEGIDMSDIDPMVAASFVQKAKAAKAAFDEQMVQLMVDHDLTKSYRRFNHNQMSDITQI